MGKQTKTLTQSFSPARQWRILMLLSLGFSEKRHVSTKSNTAQKPPKMMNEHLLELPAKSKHSWRLAESRRVWASAKSMATRSTLTRLTKKENEGPRPSTWEMTKTSSKCYTSGLA